jgi:uncharacterized membrane-anchored protein
MKSRVWLAAILVCLLQTGAIAALIINRAMLLTQGREIVLTVVPVDPRDLLRGDYVRLGYDISRIPASLLLASRRPGEGKTVYVTLERQTQSEGEKWVPVAASPEPPAAPEAENRIVLRGTMDWSWFWFAANDPFRSTAAHVKYGIESYFVPENTGGDLEKATRNGGVKAVLSVSRNGAAAIKGIIVDGVRHDVSLL